MAYQYKIKSGYENREFANSRRISDGVIESDEELVSPYLESVDSTSSTPAQEVVSAPEPELQAQTTEAQEVSN